MEHGFYNKSIYSNNLNLKEKKKKKKKKVFFFFLFFLCLYNLFSEMFL